MAEEKDTLSGLKVTSTGHALPLRRMPLPPPGPPGEVWRSGAWRRSEWVGNNNSYGAGPLVNRHHLEKIHKVRGRRHTAGKLSQTLGLDLSQLVRNRSRPFQYI